MSRPNKQHLAAVPPADAPRARGAFELIEIPTGGNVNIGGLLQELARHAFPGAFAGFCFEYSAILGSRCVLTVRTSDKFTSSHVDEGRRRIISALIGFGILKVAQPAPTPAEDGAPSPLPAPQSPST